MGKLSFLILILVMLMFGSRNNSPPFDYGAAQMPMIMEKTEDSALRDVAEYSDPDTAEWEQAYRRFLLSYTLDEYDFLPYEIWLLDLNFDNQPELAVLHNSGGSLGAYFKFYYYDGSEVKSVMNNEEKPFRCTSDARIYLDTETNSLIMYKDMTGFLGNYNLCYGYVREIVDKNGAPFVYNLIKVEQNNELDSRILFEKVRNAKTGSEDDVLTNEDIIIAEEYSNGVWCLISGEEYALKRNQIIDFNKSYVDYWEMGCHIGLFGFYEYMEMMIYEDVSNLSIIPTEDEINTLFSLWKK